VGRAASNGTARQLIAAGRELSRELDSLHFSEPVAHVYNPLAYAWSGYEQYLQTYANSARRVLFLGMNPGPFGMMQTGVPFGEVRAVREWLKLLPTVSPCPAQHPKRPVLGLECPRSEVSGKRLWGLFESRFGTPERFFEQHLVLNYCPLAFLEKTGKNRTPNVLPPAERQPLLSLCDAHLDRTVQILQPEWVIGVGEFAAQRAAEVFGGTVRVGKILHPSPASPAANRGWAEAATQQLVDLGVWNR
jgi:single-strand selective monofunctional uracil DNA glycosylase